MDILYRKSFSDQEYKEKDAEGLTQLKLATKGDIALFMDADEEIRELKGKIDYYETVVEYLQEVVKSISNRSFQIKNAIEWRKFEV